MSLTASESSNDANLPRLCGSLSLYPVALGAAMHNAGYRALGLPWHYVPFAVDELEGPLGAMRSLAIRGLGISMPFKLSILPLLDELDELAVQIGAVNTVVNDEGVLKGHNTDWVGASRAIEEARPLRDARVLRLGAGGAARAVAHGMISRGAKLTICNRDDARAGALAAATAAETVPYESRHALDEFDVLINASSRGMSDVDATSPVNEDALHGDLVVLDAVYKPLDTALVRAARARGSRTIDGSRMLLHQAAAQFELYTLQAAPLAEMDAALRAQLA